MKKVKVKKGAGILTNIQLDCTQKKKLEENRMTRRNREKEKETEKRKGKERKERKPHRDRDGDDDERQ